MKASGIGGQAVIEGVMMKNQERYAVAVRKPDGEIEVDIKEYKSSIPEAIKKLPFVRGIFNFVESMVLGMKTLTYSASFYEEEEEETKLDKAADKVAKGHGEDLIMTLTVIAAICIALALFVGFPWAVVELLRKAGLKSEFIAAAVEGVLRIVLFVGYVLAISLMKDIQRVFMYHGAEHKCINCVEHGLELNLENVRKSSKQHKRCGTSFMLFVMIISIVLFMFVRVSNPWLRLVVRLLLIPVIAGISYEFIRLAGRSENKIVEILSKPGLWLQNLTTREPEDDMIEVAIASVEPVFDWQEFLKENFEENQEP